VHELLAGKATIAEENLVVIGTTEMSASLLGQHDVVETNAVAWRVDVKLSDRRRLIPVGAKYLRNGWKTGGHRQSGLKLAIAVPSRARSGHHCASSRDADRALGIGPGKSRPDRREAIEGRGLDGRMAGTLQQAGRPLVDRQKQHVRALAGRGRGVEGHCHP
jgi:hypothetical protein